MLFSSVSFLFVFLPSVLLLYALCPRRAKNYFLLFASLFFYFLGDARHTLLLVFSALLNWAAAMLVSRSATRAEAKRLLAITVSANVFILPHNCALFNDIF